MAQSARWDSAYHAPVMAAEIVRLLRDGPAVAAIVAGQEPLALDGTLGGGGHALALLDAGFRVVGTDRDPDALAETSSRLAEHVRRAVRTTGSEPISTAASMPASPTPRAPHRW